MLSLKLRKSLERVDFGTDASFHCEIEPYVMSCKSQTACTNSTCYISGWIPPQHYVSPQLCLAQLAASLNLPEISAEVLYQQNWDFFKHSKTSQRKAWNDSSVFPTHVFDCYQSHIHRCIKPTIDDPLATCGQQKQAKISAFWSFKGTVHKEIKHTHGFLLACCVTYKSTPVALVSLLCCCAFCCLLALKTTVLLYGAFMLVRFGITLHAFLD